jgi:hypothetical protein
VSSDGAPKRRDSLRIASVDRPGWDAGAERTPRVGDDVWCVDGVAEVVRVLGRTSDGSRLLELRLVDRPKPPYFASASNVLQRREGEDPAGGAYDAAALGGTDLPGME